MAVDALIVGGGPAGLSAAQTLGRVMRRTVLIDSGETRNAPSPALHNFISRDGLPPAELRVIARDELARYSTVQLRDDAVRSVARVADGQFAVSLESGGEVVARRLLLASGVIDELPDIEGVEEIWGRSALHCPYCHGFEVRGTPIAVLGGAPDRVRMALHVTHLSDRVTICTNGIAPEADARSRLERAGVSIRENAVVRFESAGGALQRIAFADGEAIECSAVFVRTAVHQRSTLPLDLGCTMLDDGLVEIDELGRTSVAGVHAAGDMARRSSVPIPVASIVAAAAAGAFAGSVIDRSLLDDDFGLEPAF
jgi:thioredoxin reductase